MFWHHHKTGRARSRLWRAARVMTVQEIVEARRVRWVCGRAREPWLFEIEDTRRADRVE
jgi:hypothetical protein